MKTLKVLMVGNSPSVNGGITSVISQLLNHNWNENGVKMLFIPTYIKTNMVGKLIYFTKALMQIKKRLIADRPDVVHIHMSYKGSFYRKYTIHKLCKRYGISDVIHLHGSEFEKWYNESNKVTQVWVRHLLRESAAVIVLGEKWGKAVKKIEPKTNITILNNTVHIPNALCQWNEKQFQILFMGVLIKRKGVADLLHAVKILKDTNRTGMLHVMIAGNGNEEKALKEKAAVYGIEDYITFCGWVDHEQRNKLFKESQLFIMPSYNEGLPMAILEAMSYGLPIIASQVGDVDSAVKDGVNGYLIQPGDATSLANDIDIIQKNKENFEKMRKQSREIAQTAFSDTTYFKLIAELYRTVGDEKE